MTLEIQYLDHNELNSKNCYFNFSTIFDKKR